MDIMTILAIAQALGGIGGMFFRDDPTKDYARYLRMLTRETSPEKLRAAGETLWGQLEPTYSPVLTQIQGTAAGAESGMAAAMGRLGLDRSVIGAIAPTLAGSMGGYQSAQFLSTAKQAAFQQATENIFRRLGVAQPAIRPPKFQPYEQFGALLQMLSKLGPLFAKGKGGGGRGMGAWQSSAEASEDYWANPANWQ